MDEQTALEILKGIQELIDAIKKAGVSVKCLNDTYHSFEQLYDFRLAYNASLFNEWTAQGKYQVHKSLKHYDGEFCFGGDNFIVVAMLPTGQISNHYKMEHWNKFNCEEVEKALFPFDGHTPEDVLDRLFALGND